VISKYNNEQTISACCFIVHFIQLNMFKKLKARWHINSNLQFILILVVFSVTGISSVYIKDIVFRYLEINEATSLGLKTILYIVTIVPSYQVLLLFYGAVFGQFQFFLTFQKKSVKKLIGKFKISI